MNVVLDVAAAVLLLSGVTLTVLAGVGLLRFPDALTRMHAQSKPAVLGLLLILGGAALASRSVGLSATILLVAAFQLVTSPVGSHAIGRAAHRVAQVDRGLLVRDDLDDESPTDDGPTGGSPTGDSGTGDTPTGGAHRR